MKTLLALIALFCIAGCGGHIPDEIRNAVPGHYIDRTILYPEECFAKCGVWKYGYCYLPEDKWYR